MLYLVLCVLCVLVSAHAATYPYDLPQFQPVLSQCRLQCPSTSPSTVSDGKFSGISIPDYFYLNGDTMALGMSQDTGNRCELRHNIQWSTNSTRDVAQTYKATMRLTTTEELGSVTMMQVHSKKFLHYIKGPPLMLGWHRFRNGKNNNLWAKIRMELSSTTKTTRYFDLDIDPTAGFFDLQVTVWQRVLYIWVNNVLKVEHDWSYLDLPENYFKTGAYLHSPQNIDTHTVDFLALSMGADDEFSIPDASTTTTTTTTSTTPSPPTTTTTQLPSTTSTQSSTTTLTIVDSDFASGIGDFVYQDDPFQNTNEPGYASGTWAVGCLNVTLGGIDEEDILGISGGWKLSFGLDQKMDLMVEFSYHLSIATFYEPDEFSDMVVSLDGGEQQFVHLVGKSGNSVSEAAHSEEWANLSVGHHEIMFGAYNNKKTTANEVTSLCLDHIKITAVAVAATTTSTTQATTTTVATTSSQGSPVVSVTILDSDFASGTGGFVYHDDTFQKTNAPIYASGVHSDSCLKVTLGGIDETDIVGMSGGWKLSFNLAQDADLQVEFGYQFSISTYYEPDEFGDLLVTLDGGERQVVHLVGKSLSSVSETAHSEVWTNLPAGNHEIIFGAYNNKKTTANEETFLCLDHIKITADSW